MLTATKPGACAPLDLLIQDLNDIYNKLEQAEEVAEAASSSAFELAREMGAKLAEAKLAAGHGNWEQARLSIKSVRHDRPISASTACLYQRIYENWDDLGEIRTIREAAEQLKKPKEFKQQKPAEQIEAEQPKILTVLDEASPHYGQEVTVVEAQGAIVQAATADGEVIPFLKNELSSESAPARQGASNAAPKPKSSPLEAISAELEIDKFRIEALEEALREAIELLEKYAPPNAQKAHDFLETARGLLA